MSNKKILIVVGGGVKHLASFEEAAKNLGINCMLSSFSKMEYITDEKDVKLTFDGKDAASFDVIYIRLVGKRYEDASLLVSYAKDKGVKIVDSIFEKNEYIRLPLAKSLETRIFTKSQIPTPKTYFGKLDQIEKKAPQLFGYPFVIKETTGKQGHGVYSPRNEKELEKVVNELRKEEKEGKRYVAQEFIKSSQRLRVLVVGGKAIAAITRPTRWRKRFTNEEAVRKAVFPVKEEDAKIAVAAAKAVSIDIGGVDILHANGHQYVLEVNSAPMWKSIKKDTGIKVEEEILKFLISLT